MTRYVGRAPLAHAAMSPAVAIVLAFIAALVFAFGVEVALLLPYLNR